MTRLAWITAAVASLFLAGCASKVESDVARFHKLDRVVAQGSFAIVPKNPAKIGSLEFEQYASLVRGELVQLGWTPVNAGNASDYVVEIDYAINDGEQMVKSRPTAFYGFYGPYGRHRLFHHGFYPYGFYGYPYGGYNEVYSYTVYTRKLEVDILKGGSRASGNTELVFEGRAESVGRDNRLPEIMPYLVQAMFTNFPGESGVTKRVEIELPDSKGRKY